MGDEKFVKIKPFDGTGFNTWRYRMLSYLEELEVEHCVKIEAEEEDFWDIPETDTAAKKTEKEAKKQLRRKQDRRCKNAIIGAISDDYLEYTQDKDTPKKIWDGLHEVFLRKSVVNRFQLKLRLLGLKYDEKTRLESHFLRFDQLVRELKSVGAKMDDEDVICHLMLTMPTSYESVNTAMETVSEKLTLEYVKGKYLDVECKRKGTGSHDLDVPESAFAVKGRTRLRCYRCGMLGHKKVDCPDAESGEDLQQDKRTREKACAAPITFMASTGSVEGDQRWYLDTGTSEHMAKDARMFDTLKELKKPVKISTAKRGEELVARQKGTVSVIAEVGDRKLDVRIQDVLYVPGLAMNLLSLRRLECSGKLVKFGKGIVEVRNRDGVIVATGKRVGGLYAMDFVDSVTASVAMVTAKEVCRLGNGSKVEQQFLGHDEIRGGLDEDGQAGELSRSLDGDDLEVVEQRSGRCSRKEILQDEADDDVFDVGETGRGQPVNVDRFVEKLKYRRSPGWLKSKKKDSKQHWRGSLTPDKVVPNNEPIERRLKRDFVKKKQKCSHTTEWLT